MISLTSIDPALVARIDHVEKLIGRTPLYGIQHAFSKPGVQLFAKLEWQQLGQSVKARPAFQILKDALLSGQLHPGKRLLDASSGNTAIAYASIGAALGIAVTICLPENASSGRKHMLQSLGAEVIFTSPLEGTDGAQFTAKELASARPDRYFYADQYNNPNNWKAHYYSTAREVYHQSCGKLTHFVAGLGTSGTFTGTTRKLREVNPNIEFIALQPDSPMHGLEGWKHMETAQVPGIYDETLADRIDEVSTTSAIKWQQRFAQTEGMLLSLSAAANLAGAIQVAEAIDEGLIVTLFPDDGSKEVMN